MNWTFKEEWNFVCASVRGGHSKMGKLYDQRCGGVNYKQGKVSGSMQPEHRPGKRSSSLCGRRRRWGSDLRAGARIKILDGSV